MSTTSEASTSNSPFPIWRTITLGLYKDKDGYDEALRKAGWNLGGWAPQMLEATEFSCSRHPVESPLVLVTPSDLGFSLSAHYRDILTRAEGLGLRRCRPEVGPALRLTYPDQPDPNWIRIGMKPIYVCGGYSAVFAVSNLLSTPMLAGYSCRLDRLHTLKCRFIFEKSD